MECDVPRFDQTLASGLAIPSRRGFDCPPGWCRVKAERNFIAQIDAAVARYDSHSQQLQLFSRSLRYPNTRKPCRRSAKELLKREPESLEAIASLIFC